MEVLEINLKKKVVQDIINHLSKDFPDLYYTDTMSIASMVIEYIKSKKLNKDQYELVKSLSRHDVQTLMSYNSNCC
jgi:hypothetical protein